MKKIATASLVLCSLGAIVGYADILRLRNGKAMQGTLLSAGPRQVQFLTENGLVGTFPVSAVAAIEFGPGAGAPQPSHSSALTARPASAAAAPGATVPAGTTVNVRLIDGIDSTKTAVGEQFRASVDDPIVVGNRVVVPRGADALVQLVKAQGSNELYLRLYSITVAGKSYDVVSEYAQFKKKSRGRKAGRRAVGLGALGAGIGALAGDGKGAAIGAAAGAGLGAVSAGKVKIQLPPETRVSFQLRAPLPLN